MSKKHRDRLNRARILSKLIDDRNYTISEAARAMGLSERQTKRLKGEYRDHGIDALVHRNIGKRPANAISEEFLPDLLPRTT